MMLIETLRRSNWIVPLAADLDAAWEAGIAALA